MISDSASLFPGRICKGCNENLPRKSFGITSKKYKSKTYIYLNSRCNKCLRKRFGGKYPQHRGGKRQREYRASLRMEVLGAYGNKCACCGEKNEKFLTIDHVNGNGRRHRLEEIGSLSSAALYFWLKQRGFPPMFQTLCFNCNCGRAKNGGICPHKQ